jgi:nitrite reductase/ring-hydroxylating ferredoxin subunit
MPWLRAAPLAALEGRDVVGVEVGGRRVAVYRLDGAVYATSDRCPHAGAPLSRGCVVDGHIECPVHHALFDIRTGAGDGSVTAGDLATFAVKLEGGIIYVDVPVIEESAHEG